MGDNFVVPATIKTTAATGETALSKLPDNCIGIDKATGSIPAALDKGIIKGIIANSKAVPLPLSKTIIAVKATITIGKSIPALLIFSIVFCIISIIPIEVRP